MFIKITICIYMNYYTNMNQECNDNILSKSGWVVKANKILYYSLSHTHTYIHTHTHTHTHTHVLEQCIKIHSASGLETLESRYSLIVFFFIVNISKTNVSHIFLQGVIS